MSDGPALLAAIIAHPDEDTPRLVYADYLDELGTVSMPWDCKRLCGVRHDDRCGLIGGTGFVPDTSNRERAEFIRLQIAKTQWGVCPNGPQLHRSPAVCPECQRRGAAARRERELLNAHGYAWLCPALTALESERHGRACEYRRGFVESVTCPAADWLAHADAILAAHPVRKVRLTTMPDLIPFLSRDGLKRGIIGTPNREWWLRVLTEDWSGVEFDLPGNSPATASPELQDAMAVAGLEEQPEVTPGQFSEMVDQILRDAGSALGIPSSLTESAPANSGN